MSKTPDTKLLTDTELELVQILWEIGEGNVHQVMEKLPKHRDLAYTSVSTVLRILEDKGVLKARKEGRGHIYIPVLSKSDYEQRSLRHTVKNVFSNTPSTLVKQLLNTVDLSKDELDQIKNLISKMEKKS